MPDEVVFCVGITSSNGHTYHTDENCRALKESGRVLEYDRDSVSQRRDICDYCDDSVDDPDGYGSGHYRAVAEAGPQDIPP